MYVVDASSLLRVSELCGGNEARIARVFDCLFDLMNRNELGFPPGVLSACREFDSANFAATWAGPAHATQTIKSVNYSYQSDVLAICPEVLDPDLDGDEQIEVEVLAYARHFQQSGVKMTIVSEDIRKLPYRESLAFAADQLGMNFMTIAEFVTFHSL